MQHRKPARKQRKNTLQWSGGPGDKRVEAQGLNFGDVPRHILEEIIDECESLHGTEVRLTHATKRLAEFTIHGFLP